MARKPTKDKHPHVEPTWYAAEDGGPPLTELSAENQGALSPFGDDTILPLPASQVNYEPTTVKPNRPDYV